MTDLHERFQALDDLHAPELWREIEGRAATLPRRTAAPVSWALIVVLLLLGLTAGGAALIGWGLVKLPSVIEPSPTPSPGPTPPAAPTWISAASPDQSGEVQLATLLDDGRVLVLVGNERGDVSAELYNPARDSWTPTASLRQGGLRAAAVLLRNGRVLVAGGIDSDVALASAEVFDPATGTWTLTGSMNQARDHFAAVVLPDGKVLAVGGDQETPDGAVSLATAELYDPATGTWAVTGSMVAASGRASPTAVLLDDGQVLVFGGGSHSAELYDPATGSWAATTDTSGPRDGASATLLDDGTVLVAGGQDRSPGTDVDSSALSSAELYDPATGQWTVTGDMGQGRYWHTATLLRDGRVLIAGGEKAFLSFNHLSSAELYDPVTGTWSATASLSASRVGHVAVLLEDGRVLIVGGNLGAEIYDPGRAN
jgi:N-acetylneuraminic acid mutarotase